MILTSWCGQVARPNDIRRSAFSRRVGASPSAPPITKTAADRRSARHLPRRVARLALSRFSPWESSRATHAFASLCGTALPDFDDLDITQPELTAGLRRPLAVALTQLGFRTPLKPSDG